MRLTVIAAVGVGAMIGALLRLWAQRALNLSALSPVGTLLVNIIGSFVLGVMSGGLAHKAGTAWYYAITAGFCGSLTTFSSITMEVFKMIQLLETLRAFAYLAFTIGLGMLGFITGYWSGSKLLQL